MKTACLRILLSRSCPLCVVAAKNRKPTLICSIQCDAIDPNIRYRYNPPVNDIKQASIVFKNYIIPEKVLKNNLILSGSHTFLITTKQPKVFKSTLRGKKQKKEAGFITGDLRNPSPTLYHLSPTYLKQSSFSQKMVKKWMKTK